VSLDQQYYFQCHCFDKNVWKHRPAFECRSEVECKSVWGLMTLVYAEDRRWSVASFRMYNKLSDIVFFSELILNRDTPKEHKS